jgi:fructose-bisphosphate aldolase class II
VKLTKILKNSQDYVQNKFNTGQPCRFRFGGSGSTLEEIREVLAKVIKMNIDTDLQFAFTEGVRDYMVRRLSPNQIPMDPPNAYPSFLPSRLEQAFADLNNVNTL